MKKRTLLVLLGVAVMTMSGCGMAQVEFAAGMLVDSAEKVAGLASSTGSQGSAVERWVGNLAGSVTNFEIEADLDIEKIYTDIETAITEKLVDKLVSDELAEVGITMETKEDGSTTFTHSSGSEITQKEDGSWDVTYNEGEVEQLDGDWPDNEFTEQVPKPKFKPTAANTQDKSFSVAFVDTKVDEIKDYVEKLKKAGFTVDAESKDVEMFGMVAYSYIASNGKGYKVEVTYAADMCGMTITKE